MLKNSVISLRDSAMFGLTLALTLALTLGLTLSAAN